VRPGIRLGVDVGTVRIGVSRSDLHGMLASPVETVARASDGTDVRRLLQIASDVEALEIIVGLPLALSGRQTASTDDALAFADTLASRTQLPVRLVDERLSTVSAHAALRSSGKRTKQSRPVVDQVAATIILQHALDVERTSQKPPGTLVTPNIGTAP
jgi:putative Holliday junction resolvase